MIEQWFGPSPVTITEPSLDDISAWGRAYLENPEEARAILQREMPAMLEAGLATNIAVPLATWANIYDEPELALQAFRQIPKSAQIILSFHLWLPAYEGMRELPEFTEFITELGLVDYWRDSGHWPDYCRPSMMNAIVCGAFSVETGSN